MTNLTNRRITLAARPVGAPKDSDFKLIEEPVAEVGPNQVLLHTIYLSLDPYMRGRMNAVDSYAPYVEIGETMVGGAVSTVVASNHSDYKPGDLVFGYTGWQKYALVDGSNLRVIDSTAVPISTALGVLGMPGLTAYVGLLDIGQPVAGETVVVSAASGAVGAVVGQIAKIKGCRVVGVAGAEEKCRYVVDTLGFDACVSHRSDNLVEELAEVCRQKNLLLWVGGDVALARTVGANGLHLPEFMARRTRPLVPSRMTLSVSAHSILAIRRAEVIGADAVLVNTPRLAPKYLYLSKKSPSSNKL